MVDNENILETTIPASEWEEVIQFYTRVLGPPKKESEAEVVFAISGSESELRAIRGEDEEKLTNLKPPRYFRARSGRHVIEVYNQLLASDKTAFSIAAPHQIGPRGRVTTLAYVGFGDPYLFAKATFLLEGEIVCIIHNPDWN